MAVNAQKPESPSSTDLIEKRFVLRAPRSRVWRAITIAEQFGEWFRMKLDGEFAAGRTIRGRVLYPGYEHLTLDILVERVEPEHYFSYRWHPYPMRSEEHTSELQSRRDLVCRLLLEKKNI